MFRVYERIADFDVEDPAAGGDQFRFHAQGGVDLGGQTDRGGFVVSLGAVGDRDVHVSALAWVGYEYSAIRSDTAVAMSWAHR